VITEADRAAVAAFPELQRLIDLRGADWAFMPGKDGEGELRQINAVRPWPGGYADALRVRYTTDAAGIRCDHTGGVLWQRDGTLAEVVDGLLALPTPGSRLAPRLVVGRAPSPWTPTTPCR
jgi:hypothetical protein